MHVALFCDRVGCYLFTFQCSSTINDHLNHYNLTSDDVVNLKPQKHIDQSVHLGECFSRNFHKMSLKYGLLFKK